MPAPELRRIKNEDYPGFATSMGRSFGFDYVPEEDTIRPVLDLDRAFGHIDRGEVVSTLGAFSLEMTVPGAVTRCGGTTMVTVSPTHRRRGLLTEMMERHLVDVAEHDEPMAALWAAESEIYGRFGYGRATRNARVVIHRRGHPLSRHAPQPFPVRSITPEQAREVVPGLHDRFLPSQPGMWRRWEAWWDARVFSDLPSRRRGYGAARWALVEGPDGPDGYTRYRIKGGEGDDGHSANEIQVLELYAFSAEGWAGLWSFLINHDLVGKVMSHLRAPHDPIFDLLAGPRRALAEVDDGLWVRILDVPAALSARSYQSRFAGVIEVHDPMGISAGRYQLEADAEGSECTSTTQTADITLDIEDLGSVYLGDAGFRRLARVGRVTGSEEALAAADLAFGWDPAPWCPEIF